MHGSSKAEGAVQADAKASAEQRGKSIKLNDQTRNRLGLHLRAMYAEIVSQPVPDRFADLIEQLDQTSHQARETV